MASDDWYRSPDWDATVKAEFERRLARARPKGRAQYRHIKATALVATNDPRMQASAFALWEQNLTDPNAYEFERVTALSFLGAYEQKAGLFAAAEAHLRAALDLMASNRSGSTDLEEVRLAEILIQRGGSAALLEARSLIEQLGETQPLLLNDRFRKCVAGARVAIALGDDGQAADWSRQALALASARHSGLANHPSLGLVETDASMRAWLAAVAQRGTVEWAVSSEQRNIHDEQ